MDLQTLSTYIRRTIDNPQRILKLFSSAAVRGMVLNMWREPSSYAFTAGITNISLNLFQKYQKEIRSDKKFRSHLNEEYRKVRKVHLPNLQGWTEIIYILIRHIKPNVIIETGVFDGTSSAFILNALAKNNKGTLLSVDLPARKVILGSTDLMPFPTLPSDKDPGWLIPSQLKRRWRLHKISEGHELKQIVKKIKSIDIFLHDSLHTKEHMDWEMQTVWPHLKKGGILLVDDIFCNSAFEEFCRAKRKEVLFKYGLGAVRK